MTAIPQPSEHDEQRVLVEQLQWWHLDFVAPANGSKFAGGKVQRAIQWNKLVSLGASPGIPDLLIFTPAPAWSWCRVLGVEMKRPGEKPTPEQLAWHERIKACGGHVIVAYSATEAIDALKAIGYGARPA